MSWDPNVFAGLVFQSSSGNNDRLHWAGVEGFDGPLVTCSLYTFLAGAWTPTGSTSCKTMSTVPDSDGIAIPSPLLADFVTVEVTISTIYQAGAPPDDPCYAAGEHATGLSSGGCRPGVVSEPDAYVETASGAMTVIDIDGITTNSVLTPLQQGGSSWYLVNPSPPVYTGIDPTNDANQILWDAGDIPGMLASIWLHFGSPGQTVRVAHATGTLEIDLRRHGYVGLTSPEGLMCVL